jgi:hypothetical protein
MWTTFIDSGEMRIVSREKQGERTRVVLRLEKVRVSYPVFGMIVHAHVEQLVTIAGARDVVAIRPVNHLGEEGIEWELHCSYRS